MPKKEAFTAEQVIEALEDGKGYVGKAAANLGCFPQTVYNYAERYPTVRKAWDAIREKRHDSVENSLMQRIDDGDTTAIIFYLKTQCKSRGYVERQEVTGAEGGKIEIEVVYVNKSTG